MKALKILSLALLIFIGGALVPSNNSNVAIAATSGPEYGEEYVIVQDSSSFWRLVAEIAVAVLFNIDFSTGAETNPPESMIYCTCQKGGCYADVANSIAARCRAGYNTNCSASHANCPPQ